MTPNNNKKDNYIIITLFILSLLDTGFTLLFIETGFAIEMNPMMDFLLSKSYIYFLFYKLFITAVFCYLFYIYLSAYKYMRPILYFITSIYSLLLLYHLYGFTEWLRTHI